MSLKNGSGEEKAAAFRRMVDMSLEPSEIKSDWPTYSQFKAQVENITMDFLEVLQKHQKAGVSGEATMLAILNVAGKQAMSAFRAMHGPAAPAAMMLMAIGTMKACESSGLKEVDAPFVLATCAGAVLEALSKRHLPGGELLTPDQQLSI